MSESNQVKSRTKLKSKKAWFVTAGVIGLLGLSAPQVYTKVIVPKLDAKYYAQAQEQVSALVDNEYTGAIKSHVTTKDVMEIEGTIKKIKSKSLQGSLKKETQSVLDQVRVQSDSVEELERLSKIKTHADVNVEHVKSLIEKSGGIKNVELRAKILREANIILEHHEYASRVIQEVNALTPGDWASYYTAEVNVNSVQYAEVRKDLTKKLEAIRKSAEEQSKTQNEAERNQVNAAVEAASKVKLKDVQRGTSERIVVANKVDSEALRYFIKNPGVKYLILVMDSNIYLYGEDGSVTYGYSAKVFESVSGTSSLSVKESRNLAIAGSSTSTASSASIGDGETSSSSDTSSNRGRYITFGSDTMGTHVQNTLVVSQAFFEEVSKAISETNQGEVAFYAK